MHLEQLSFKFTAKALRVKTQPYSLEPIRNLALNVEKFCNISTGLGNSNLKNSFISKERQNFLSNLLSVAHESVFDVDFVLSNLVEKGLVSKF